MYFRTAGSLLRFSWFDYTLVSAAFLHVVVGLEGILRLSYAADRCTGFKSLLERAFRNGAILDAIFRDVPKEFRDLIQKETRSRPASLATFLPALRNEYLHGAYRLSPKFLPLALRVREAADVIWSHSNSSLIASQRRATHR